MDKKSPDAFRTISEVADWLGVPTHVLRFWESRFTQVKPVKRAGGRRYYRPTDMELLGGIRKLLHDDGMTIRGVQKLLREHGVKHVAAMSPPLDSEIGETTATNVVPFDAAHEEPDTNVVEATALPTATAEHQGEDATPAEDVPQPELTGQGETVQAETEELQQDTAQSTSDPVGASSPVAEDVPAETEPEQAPEHASVSTGEEVGDDLTDAPSDPLEPIPHDGPTIADTLASHPAPSDADAKSETTAEPSDETPDEYHVSSQNAEALADDALTAEEPDQPPMADAPSSEGDASSSMDLFSFADAPTPADTTTPVDQMDTSEPDPIDQHAEEPEIESRDDSDAEDVPEEPPAADPVPEEPLPEDVEPLVAEELDTEPVSAPLIGDISQIPSDAEEGEIDVPAPLTLALREAQLHGTNAHLPVLQALADRLDALATQMNRGSRG
ncbi:MerR family transcriptional regulator [Aliiroseovarius sp. KMU-50]|uniref:MerR family transcriptional regulator n=1 Tax=Aliiroseovarius salicola TaxID=3009082 RepID=A0ABT4W1B8_9RHOB|nr:MerR family transcriptional regulator [Aliiroseovarius sp. KMU-50]MDA5094313.1 MerR family transcriptional regulator [Aliiroseovarius sp. KMU-50]